MLGTVCQGVGALVLVSLVLWLVLVALSKLRRRPLLDRLTSRAVLITGCDSGFGHGVARRLDSLGVPVFAGCLLPEGPGARSLAKDCSSRLRVLPLDVTSDQQVADAVVSVEAALKEAPGTELWAVLNNAGISDWGEMENTPLEKFQQVLDVNTVGPIRVAKAFLPHLKKSKGRLVNVASPAGRFALPMLGPYCLAKSALIMFTDAFRLEMKKWSVTASSIEPFLYHTPISNVECLKAKYLENTEKTLSDDKDRIRQEARKNSEILLQAIKLVAKDNISLVIDEMVIACVGRDVQRRHIPGFIDTILLTVAFTLPNWLMDYIHQLLIKILRIIWRYRSC